MARCRDPWQVPPNMRVIASRACGRSWRSARSHPCIYQACATSGGHRRMSRRLHFRMQQQWQRNCTRPGCPIPTAQPMSAPPPLPPQTARRSLPTSTRRGAPTLSSTSWCSTRAMCCRACEPGACAVAVLGSAVRRPAAAAACSRVGWLPTAWERAAGSLDDRVRPRAIFKCLAQQLQAVTRLFYNPPRYLMVAVGCLFIRSGEGSSKELLKDLVEVGGDLRRSGGDLAAIWRRSGGDLRSSANPPWPLRSECNGWRHQLSGPRECRVCRAVPAPSAGLR